MTVFVALLGAINVGGTCKLATRDLIHVCESAGFRHVRTYIASGNVVFESDLSEATVKTTLETRLLDHAGRTVGAGCAWLTERELRVYAAEYPRTGLQGPLQGYRCRMDGSLARELGRFAGRPIEVPVLFVAGRSDWGPFQAPGQCVHHSHGSIAPTSLSARGLNPGAWT